jgi:hypothetical protein
VVEKVAVPVVRIFEVVMTNGAVVRLDFTVTERLEAPSGTTVGAAVLVVAFTRDKAVGVAISRSEGAAGPVLIGQIVVYIAIFSVMTDPIFAGQSVTVAAQLVMV